MAKTVEFFFDFNSPFAYLANTQLPQLAERLGASLVYKPALITAVFEGAGSSTPLAVPAKARHLDTDLRRWAAFYRVPFAFNPHFPFKTVPMLRGMVAYKDDPRARAYCDAVFSAIWSQGANLHEPEVLADALRAADIDPEEFDERIADPAVKDELRANGEEALARGVFGMPTFFVGEEMFWGQDRLHFVGEALAAQSN